MEATCRFQARALLLHALPVCLSPIDRCCIAREHHLTRAVEVRRQQDIFASAGLAHRFSIFMACSEQCQHRTFTLLTSLSHRARADFEQLERIIERKNARERKRADLAEREADKGIGLLALRHERFADRHREHHRERLCVERIVHLFSAALFCKVHKIDLEHLRSTLEHFAHLEDIQKVGAHTFALSALT